MRKNAEDEEVEESLEWGGRCCWSDSETVLVRTWLIADVELRRRTAPNLERSDFFPWMSGLEVEGVIVVGKTWSWLWLRTG